MDLRWAPDLSPDYPQQQIYAVGRLMDALTGEVFVMVRKARCPPWVLSVDEWERLAPVVVYDRDGAA